jgi:hypothetical protein
VSYDPLAHDHHAPGEQPTLAELEAIHAYFAKAAGEAQSPGWESLYLDMADVSGDVIAALKGEVDPDDF